MKSILFLLALMSVGATFAQNNIIPTPQKIVFQGEDFILEDELLVNETNLPDNAKKLLLTYWTQQLKKNIVFTKNGNGVSFTSLQNVPNDSYTLQVDQTIRIAYSSNQSCLYALYSLFQLIDQKEQKIPACFVSDAPKFAWRGMHLDVSRHFYDVTTIKKYLDWMSFYKLNTFHWHLSDDQGWRIEIKKYPLLTSIGARRDSTWLGHASENSKGYSKKLIDGYYSQEDIREVVEYAEQRGIIVVPEIELPGHAAAALAAYPEMGCTGKDVAVKTTWGVFNDVFCSKPETMEFLKDILQEVCQLFPGKYIHVGGDEVPLKNWEECPNCKKNLSIHGYENPRQLQQLFLEEMEEVLTANGKTLIGWDEILEGGLSPNAVVMSWRGEKGGVEAAQKEHFVVMSPTSHCYFDHYQGSGPNEPLAIGGFTPLEKVFNFNPIPKGLKPYQENYILGAQANLWTEYISTESHLDYMIFPRLLALSEKVWAAGSSTYDEFLGKLVNFHLPLLKESNIHFSKSFMAPAISYNQVGEDVILSVLPFADWSGVSLSSTGKQWMETKGELKFKMPKSELKTKHELDIKVETEKGQFETITTEFYSHSMVGKLWTLGTKPSPNYPGKGAFTLSDGQFGKRPWNGKDWLGFQEDTVRLSYDYGTLNNHGSVALSFLEAPSSWIYLPQSISATYTLKKGKKKTVVFPVTNEKVIISYPKKYAKVELEIISNSKIPAGQAGEGHTPWLFMDEIYLEP